MEKEYVGIRQATKEGYLKCEIGGVADFLYPTSKHRRGRVQGDGQISPTITAENTGICRVEKVKKSECIGNLSKKEEQEKNGFLNYKCNFCIPEFGDGDNGKEIQIVDKENGKGMNQAEHELSLNDNNIKKNIRALDEQNQTIRQETFGTLTTDGSSPKHNNRVLEEPDWENTEYRIRKITPKECYRLMDVSDIDSEKMLSINSQTQCYKQAGNSIVVSVLCAIFSQLNIQGIKTWNERTDEEKRMLTALKK